MRQNQLGKPQGGLRAYPTNLPNYLGKWLILKVGGEEGIRTLVGIFVPHPISSRRRYDRFGTSPGL